METAEVMAIIGGHVDTELLKRNEYLAAENEIFFSKIEGRIKFTDDERRRLAILGQELGRKALADIGPIVKPETIFTWYRKLIAEKFDSSKSPKRSGRPKKEKELEDLVVRIAKENNTWGYDRIAGAVTNLGYKISDETVGNILRRHGVPPVRGRHRGMAWSEFIEQHQDVLVGHQAIAASRNVTKFERNHQGLENVIPFPKDPNDSGPIRRRDRLGGMLKFYYRLDQLRIIAFTEPYFFGVSRSYREFTTLS